MERDNKKRKRDTNKMKSPHKRSSLLKMDNDDTRDFAIFLNQILESFNVKSEYLDSFELQDIIHLNLNDFLNERFNANIKEGETK